MTATESFPVTKKNYTRSLTMGLALFSMFFGAGNLVFPLLIGKAVGKNAWFALSGLGITAIIIPFLGLATMLLFQADLNRFFFRVGKVPGFLLLLLLQLILGPLGVIPRLVTLMHALARPYFFDVSLLWFSIGAAAVIFFLSFKRQTIVRTLGLVTPFLLLCIVILVAVGVWNGSSFSPTIGPSQKSSFLQGLVGGYNTMDLIAAFMFATVMVPHFREEMKIDSASQRGVSLLRKMALPSIIAASLLFLTYAGLAWISAFHGWTIDSSHAPEELLSAIAIKLLGKTGGFIAALTVIFACLTTAITLAAIFAEYLQKDLMRNKIKSHFSLFLTLAITTVFANLGFRGIASFLGPILQIVYPGLIVLTILNLLHCFYGVRSVKLPVFLTLLGSAIIYISK